MSQQAPSVRSRLLLGFGLGMVALVATGLLGLRSIRAVSRAADEALVGVGDVGHSMARAQRVALEFVGLAQAKLMGAPGIPQEQLDSLSGVADSLHRVLLGSAHLTSQERIRLQRISGLQARIEVFLSVGQAYQDIGRASDAFRQAQRAAASLDTLLVHAGAVDDLLVDRLAAGSEQVRSITAGRRSWLWGLLLVGLVTGFVFIQITWRAVTWPLDQLVDAARTLGRGDLRTPVYSEGMGREFLVLADVFGEMLEYLRTIVSEVQREADTVTSAAATL